MKVKFKFYRGLLASWEQLFGQAAEFAESLGSERLINISHSNSGGDGTVTVWYWAEEETTVGPDDRFSRAID